ncbi:MAG: signal peptidase I [Clostridia bacterium]|nr:signal peptidase I [Clostridia bacterium]
MKHTQIELPTKEQIAAEHKRLEYQKRYLKNLRSTVAVLIVVAALAVLVATLWMPVLRIYGSSMTPTLQDGEIVVSIKHRSFSAGDIVAFYHGNKLLVKRCVAGPSDWVDIDEDGNIYVNDVLLDEPYIEEKAFGECDITLPYQVPDDRWFLVGDNRDVSVDSRNTAVGAISSEQIVGEIVFCLWPLGNFGWIH